MTLRSSLSLGFFLLLLMPLHPLAAAESPSAAWHFAVAGDSRNCGDIVMPAIAAAVKRDGAAFYWHLGDLRRVEASS